MARESLPTDSSAVRRHPWLLFSANNSACKCIFVTNGSVLRFLIIIIIMGFWKLASGSGNDNKGWEKTCCLCGECLWNSQWGWEEKLMLYFPQTPKYTITPKQPTSSSSASSPSTCSPSIPLSHEPGTVMELKSGHCWLFPLGVAHVL